MASRVLSALAAPLSLAAGAVRGVVAVAKSKIRERRKAKERSPHWSRLRDVFLRQHPSCAACGLRKGLQVHHKRPYHLHPELELDTTNLVTLCMTVRRQCHLDLGHGGDYGCWNPEVEADAAEVLSRRTARAVVEKRARMARLRTDQPSSSS